MAQDERGYLILPHDLATGADCDGCLTVVERGDMAEIKCNSCGATAKLSKMERRDLGARTYLRRLQDDRTLHAVTSS